MLTLRRHFLLIALVLGVTVAGCGSSMPGSHPASASAAAGHPSALWKLDLSGRVGQPRGARSGRGIAIIALHGSAVLCWRFAHLHGFTAPTGARLQSGLSARTPAVLELHSGTVFHHQGCRKITTSLATSLKATPRRYAVSIDAAGYPAGAVRGRLP